MIADGLAIAIPSKTVERFLRGGKRPYIGVTLRPVQVPFENDRVLGLLILSVESGSPAQKAGFQIGDVLIRACGQLFNTSDNLTSILWHAQPGELLPIEFLRSQKHRHCLVVVGGEKGVADNAFTQVKSA
jgi:serine protease Do